MYANDAIGAEEYETAGETTAWLNVVGAVYELVNEMAGSGAAYFGAALNDDDCNWWCIQI